MALSGIYPFLGLKKSVRALRVGCPFTVQEAGVEIGTKMFLTIFKKKKLSKKRLEPCSTPRVLVICPVTHPLYYM